MAASSDYRLGSIWLVTFDPSVGTEIRKTRPAVIISGTPFNQRSKVTVLPITSAVPNGSSGIAIAYSLECDIFLYSIMGNQDILPRFTTVIEHIV